MVCFIFVKYFKWDGIKIFFSVGENQSFFFTKLNHFFNGSIDQIALANVCNLFYYITYIVDYILSKNCNTFLPISMISTTITKVSDDLLQETIVMKFVSCYFSVKQSLRC